MGKLRDPCYKKEVELRMPKEKKTATVIDVARAVNCSPYTVRILADRGLVDMKRDYNNWRRFPNLAKSILEITNLIYSESLPGRE